MVYDGLRYVQWQRRLSEEAIDQGLKRADFVRQL